ncbi:MAG TPA: tetratricopeptide repeat protein, partial [Sphingobacteriaceae bacterium]
MKKGKLFFLTGLALFGLTIISACSSSKDTAASRGMQNLTARYNILYNARILIEESERNLQAAYRDDYTQLLPVFEEPTAELAQIETKNLDKAIDKVTVIISEKSESQYVDDAYFLIAKANHLKAQYFNAAEFFDYLYKSYPDEKEKRMQAMAWKGRSQMALQRFEEAEATLDTAVKYLKPKSKAAAEVLAARAQLHLYAREDTQAIRLLEKARKLTRDKSLGLRWTFILAQLQEVGGQKEQAKSLYSSVIKSNAPFDLAFNAKLNRIALQYGNDSRETKDRIAKLRALVKDDKNKSFVDQIYYEIGKVYAGTNDMESAIDNFNTAIRKSTTNDEQKGLAYLTLAELYFSQSKYPLSKVYYDSTLQVLPKNHRQYNTIFKKAGNLDLLSSQLSIIAREDTLQMLASLSEADREKRIGQLVRMNAANTIQGSSTSTLTPILPATADVPVNSVGKFYFNNTAALSQGFSDFKRKWGNRKLEDNWRTSQRSSAQVTNNMNMAPPNPDEMGSSTTPIAGTMKSEAELRQEYLTGLPLTPQMRAASDQRIIGAYHEIAAFYKDILDDKPQAIQAYEELLRRYPKNDITAQVHYNLFRLYSETDPGKAEESKKILLSQFPETSYAKVILDPEYAQKMSDKEAALTRAYNDVYELYESRKYPDAIVAATKLMEQEPGNRLSPQLAYLKAMANGHLQKLPVFESDLRAIVARHPADSLITPLVKQHLRYIDQHRDKLGKRNFALLDFDASEPRWLDEPEREKTLATAPKNEASDQAAAKPKDAPESSKVPETAPLALQEDIPYYFVVNVQDPRVNLSSSRFGIGQFNRSRYAGSTIKHQLKSVNNQNQLIFVGEFNNKTEAIE